MDLQGVLRQKDAELEQRAALLMKTKGAIEQLQEELGGARQEVEKWRKAADRQGGELANAQRQAQLLEQEIEGKAREGSALLAETLALKRKLQESDDGLHNVADGHSAEQAVLVGNLRDTERALAASQADAKAQREQAAALHALVADKNRGLAEQAGSLLRLEQQRSQLEAGNTTLREQLAVVQRQRQEVEAAAEQLQGRLGASTQQLEGRLAGEVGARQRAEQHATAAREALADEQKRHALDSSAWERRLREVQEDAAERLQAREAAWEAQQDKAKREAQAAVEDTKRQLTKRLYLAEGEWAKKLQQSSADWAAKLDSLGDEWRQRGSADQAAWGAERQRLQEELEGRLADAEQEHAGAVEEVRQHYRRKVAAAEAKAVAAEQGSDRVWQHRLKAAASKAEGERQAALDSLAVAAAQREQHVLCQLAAVQEASAVKLAELDKQWALKLAAAEEKGLRERYGLERQWADKLHAADKAAAEAQTSLRSQLEARLASVSERVGFIVQKENKHERKREQLLRQVGELEASGEGERGRRREVEAALHEASDIFKRELADKNQQLDLLRQEVRFLRTWAGDMNAGAALPSAFDGIPAMLPGRLTVAASVAPQSPARSPSPCAAGQFSPAFYRTGACTSHCFSAPVSPAADGAAGAATAARAVDAEVKALRSARRAYQRAALGQQELCISMARTINEALREDVPLPPAASHRPESAGGGSIAASLGRRKWKRDLAAELQGLCSRDGYN